MEKAVAKSETATAPEPVPEPLKKIDEAVIAPRPTRKYRAAAFQIYVLGAAVVFVALAVIAHFVAYFPMDLTITRAVQGYHGQLFDKLMYAVSWAGFFPQVIPIGLVVIVGLWIAGLRWEAVTTLIGTVSTGVGALIKLVVYRPRPSADLVHVFAQLPSSGFPSGHVLSCTAFCGFLVFLCYTLLKPSIGRTIAITVLSIIIALMGLSRIYMGQHWFSDVMGAYLFGSLWLALTIKVYRWGKTRYFVHQPVAPAEPAAPTGSTPAAMGKS